MANLESRTPGYLHSHFLRTVSGLDLSGEILNPPQRTQRIVDAIDEIKKEFDRLNPNGQQRQLEIIARSLPPDMLRGIVHTIGFALEEGMLPPRQLSYYTEPSTDSDNKPLWTYTPTRSTELFSEDLAGHDHSAALFLDNHMRLFGPKAPHDLLVPSLQRAFMALGVVPYDSERAMWECVDEGRPAIRAFNTGANMYVLNLLKERAVGQ